MTESRNQAQNVKGNIQRRGLPAALPDGDYYNPWRGVQGKRLSSGDNAVSKSDNLENASPVLSEPKGGYDSLFEFSFRAES